MNIENTDIAGVHIIRLSPRGDDRGYFMRTYDHEIFAAHGLQVNWVQENQSLSSKRGTVRGLHFQRGAAAETKLVRALRGSVLDVAVDLRLHSPTYGAFVAVELSEANHTALYIPKGCAHGFFTLEDLSVVAYKVDAPYTPDAEGGLLWSDPAISIPWPKDIEVACLSEKDALWPTITHVAPIEIH